VTGLLVAFGAVALSGCDVAASDAVAPCRAGAIVVTAGQFGVGPGHFGGGLLFTNRGAATCTLHGYPVVHAVPAGRGRAAAAKNTSRGYLGGLLPGVTHPPTVTLAPGAVASAVLEGSVSTVPRSPACPSDDALLVAIPGSGATTRLAIETSSCSHLEVHPIVPGRSGEQSP
jgi:hypothetical protein